MIATLLLRVRIWSVRLGFAIGRRQPVKARILFATAHGSALSGNLAMLRDALVRRGLGPSTAQLVHGGSSGGLRGRLALLRHGFVAGYHLATSRVVVVDDYFFPIYVVTPRRETTIIQVWHACGAFKQFGYSVADKTFGADARLLRHVRIHTNYDVCLVSSMAVAPHYAEAFGQPLERFRSDLGVPRTDVLFGEEHIQRVVADIRHRYALPPDKRVILYAPTFRGESVGVARADGLPDWRLLRDALAADHILLVRLHPFIREALVIDRELDGFLTDVSDHPDINELLHVADILVTDYSSVIFEFALLGRPMVFYAPDLAAYERERGFYFDYRSGVPGPVVESDAALASALRDPAPDLERVRGFARQAFDVADGGATDRVLDRLLLPALHRD
ncbi:MAG: CDP-glycerol glycerophosphotransferase family protein [Candidatus Limnocylindrales bacterium]